MSFHLLKLSGFREGAFFYLGDHFINFKPSAIFFLSSSGIIHACQKIEHEFQKFGSLSIFFMLTIYSTPT